MSNGYEMSNVYDINEEKAWCPGCGNHVIQECIKQALLELNLMPYQVLICSGIGQAAKLPHYVSANGFNGLHGRALPPAVAAKMVNPNLNVIVHTGDGDCYGEGGNHLLHNIRRNVDITLFVHNNGVYGLTKGQASPTTEIGRKTGVQTEGVILSPLNPISLAISQNISFAARGFTGEREHLVDLMKEAIKHKGFALVDILQPCVVFNKVNTFKWYKERVYKLNEEYDYKDRINAFSKSLEWDEGIPIGVIYKTQRTPFMDGLEHLKGKPPLIERDYGPLDAQEYMKDFF
ncbi:2-oxoacid:ferredoxin oxidoreductase subunit beta [Desulfitibacter alkalitolerans]|uniref:2-oxoacid:ferredoxin oxidoreductase subunit beta n=1 Tax=Desulfitibacter alkalitolerans TaxID=264641 RepID=UPI000A40E8A5|nr:2-oxoacid:ferredoxin oxidoreductase subunit beta [Desulfitibacter alkalitolerans]